MCFFSAVVLHVTLRFCAGYVLVYFFIVNSVCAEWNPGSLVEDHHPFCQMSHAHVTFQLRGLFFNLTKYHSPQQNCTLNSSKNTTEIFLQICRKHLPKNFVVEVISSVMLNVKNTMAQGCWRQTFPSEYIGCSQSSQMQWAGSTLQLTAYLFLECYWWES